MSDEGLRTLERAWAADPRDQGLFERLRAEHRRRGSALPWRVTRARLRPAFRLDAPPYLVWVERPDGTREPLDAPDVPEHRRLIVMSPMDEDPARPASLHEALRRQEDELSVRLCFPDPARFAVAARLDRLSWLECDGDSRAPLVDDDLAPLADAVRLQCLRMLDAHVEGRGLAALTDLPDLASITLAEAPGATTFGQGLVDALLALPRLTAVAVERCRPATAALLAPLAQAARVDLLRLSGGLRDEHLAWVGRMTWLRELDLSGCLALSPGAVEHLAPLRGLERLTLRGCPRLGPGAAGRLAGLLPDTRLELDEPGAPPPRLTYEDRLIHGCARCQPWRPPTGHDWATGHDWVLRCGGCELEYGFFGCSCDGCCGEGRYRDMGGGREHFTL